MTNDLRYNLKQYEQKVATLSANGSRLETQLARYKTTVEKAEQVEDELKSEKRKALREVRLFISMLIKLFNLIIEFS